MPTNIQPRSSRQRHRFAQRIIVWQQQHGRHDLPWQNTRDAYRIWVSEIMLQQTQVAAVIGYYARFMARFPDVATLAATPLDDVMPYWAGLGYYARARNLHKAACIVMTQFGGTFPRHFDDVWALPGVGRSTAAAICAFAYGEPRPILDGNVKRVFARVFGVEGDVRSKAVEDIMWDIALRETPRDNIDAYIQGQMDLGATLCTRSAPACVSCPLQTQCVAFRDGRTASLPQRSAKKATPTRTVQMLVLIHAGQVLLQRRPPTGIWGGLWSLPEAATDEDAASLISMAKVRFGVHISRGQKFETIALITHGFTHFTLTITPQLMRVAKVNATAAEAGVMWLNLQEIENAALPAPVSALLKRVRMAR